ncbi:methylglyoxal synthase [Elizabethkingia sp. JS20170427COW]|uniref:methylglyoxal synthase n=1 Tax=Elizabethkingia sp. JS20170427COW TaxID=2583851 RepID=UPI0011105866|nr:methylglyoxal synthase [Elizabethkingia sp. JS20170427COW]QCX54035.1 methylglyoxal synthase [Elizabethkingia sp. JS20170427COW]
MKTVKTLPERKTIALVAHDNKKEDLLNWIDVHADKLQMHNLVATGTTGRLISEKLGVNVQRVLSGPLGGDQQLGSMIAEKKIDIVIFFWDPMESQPHDSDVKAFLRLCVVWNVPMACDPATADFILSSPYMCTEYQAMVPDYNNYLKRNIPES